MFDAELVLRIQVEASSRIFAAAVIAGSVESATDHEDRDAVLKWASICAGQLVGIAMEATEAAIGSDSESMTG